VLQTGVGSVGGGATEMGDSFFRCAMRRGRMWALLMTTNGVGAALRGALELGYELGMQCSKQCQIGCPFAENSVRARYAASKVTF